MKPLRFALLVAGALFVGLGSLSAQPGGAAFQKDTVRATLDFRVGALWPGRETAFAEAKTRFDFGVRVAPYLGQGRVTHRLSLQFAFDYIPVSRFDYFDPVLGSDARLRESIVAFGPALGFDIVQTPQVDITVRYGAAALANLTRLELPDVYGNWEDVCHLEAFEGACPSRWNFVGNAGTSLRIFPKKDFPLYFGVDYTRYAGIKNQLVGIIGLGF
jgi:hypothetical protein